MVMASFHGDEALTKTRPKLISPTLRTCVTYISQSRVQSQLESPVPGSGFPGRIQRQDRSRWGLSSVPSSLEDVQSTALLLVSTYILSSACYGVLVLCLLILSE